MTLHRLLSVSLLALFLVFPLYGGPHGTSSDAFRSGPIKKKIILHGVSIDPDRYVVQPEAEPVLETAVEMLKEEQGPVTIVVAGPTSQDVPESARVRAVRSYLLDSGIRANRARVRAPLVSVDANVAGAPAELRAN